MPVEHLVRRLTTVTVGISIWIMVTMSLTCFLLCGGSRAEGFVSVPEVARPAFDQALAAVKQGDWTAAVEHFEAARAVARGNPIILFNLGLAESMIGGHEIRAAAWFRAYLEGRPNAENAADVRQEITKLLDIGKKNVSKHIDLMSQLAQSWHDYHRWVAAWTALTFGIIVGDPKRTVGDAIAAAHSPPPGTDFGISNNVFITLVFAGHTLDAMNLARGVYEIAETHSDARCSASVGQYGLLSIALAQARIGDIEGAKATFAKGGDAIAGSRSQLDTEIGSFYASHNRAADAIKLVASGSTRSRDWSGTVSLWRLDDGISRGFA